MNSPPERRPSGWADDEVSSFLETAQANRLASFVHLRQDYRVAMRVDRCYRQAVSLADNSEHWLPAIFLLRSHSSFLAAISMAMSGQVAEAQPLIWTTLEHALYGFYIFKNPDLASVWLSRHDGEAERKNQRREFTAAKLINALSGARPNIGRVASQIYERAIDYGAHPNERSLTTGLSIAKQGGAVKLMSAYLVNEPLKITFTLKSCSQAGLCSIEIFETIMPERFRVSSLDRELESLRKEL